jgi:salicylate hydroxylase
MDKKFNVAIIDAGRGGLAAAIGIAKADHRVTIVERAPGLAEVKISNLLLRTTSTKFTNKYLQISAGIQVPPNSTPILKR